MSDIYVYLIIGGICAVVLYFALTGKEDKPIVIQPGVPASGINSSGSYSGHSKKWGWSNCPEDVIDAGTYWVNRDDGRCFLLGAFTANPIATYGAYPKSYIKEVAPRPPKGTCVDVV
jgi:hypothetical protein